jgi:hypothetical protein
MSNEVGYRRPPVSGQFKKGASGNPKGRPKGSKNFLTLLEKELAQKIVVNENGKKRSITRLQAMVKRMVAGALQGDHKALLSLVDILRRNSQLQPPEVQDLVPDNYMQILEAYVQGRQKKAAKAPPSSSGAPS